MLKLVTDDGRKFIVSKTALKASYTLADLRYCFDAGDTSEVTVEEPIEIHFDSKLLALGLEWCDSQNGEEFLGRKVTPYSRRYIRAELSDWEVQFLTTDTARLVRLAHVAQFLRIPTLYMAACAAIADNVPVDCYAKVITKRERQALLDLFGETRKKKAHSEWIPDRMLLDVLMFMTPARLERCKSISKRSLKMAQRHHRSMPREVLDEWCCEMAGLRYNEFFSHSQPDVPLSSLARYGVRYMRVTADSLSAVLIRLSNAQRRSIHVRELAISRLNVNDAAELAKVDALLDKIGSLQTLRLPAARCRGPAAEYKFRNCGATLHFAGPKRYDPATALVVKRLPRIYDGPMDVSNQNAAPIEIG
ncbi:hypothetical protein AAVH_12834 [Aphelenchoides avenae]|nr:hypothetical protein AAVH_12834 [Aphelenchus avenae]